MESANDAPRECCCILHVEEKPESKKQRQDVLPFGESHWRTVQSAALNRKKKRNFHSSKYYPVVQRLPEQPSPQDGYHVTCYKNFTAVISETAETSETAGTSSNVPNLRSSSGTPEITPDSSKSSAGIFPKSCLFCCKTKKRTQKGFELLGSCETLEACQKIQEAAATLKDDAMLAQVFGIDLIAKEAKYHHSCRSSYLLKAGRATDRDEQDIEEAGSGSGAAMSNIFTYIEQSVIAERRPEMFSSVHERYMDFCLASDETPLQSRGLARNVEVKFKERIRIRCLLGNKAGNIIFSAETAEDAIRVAYDYTASDERTLPKAALLLRKHLLSVERAEYSDTVTLDDLREGDATPPEIVVNFFNTLYGGLTDKVSDQVKRRANSASQDALFIVKRGLVKPAKHVALGTSVKSITGSKKLVNVLNRFGHCLNYNSLEELETATAEAIQERETSSPEGTVQLSPMGLAFNNFDELTQTLSGADTLRDTMGILYQNIPAVPMKSVESSTGTRPAPCTASTKGPQQKKGSIKRSLDIPEMPLAPYRGVPKMTVFSYSKTDVFILPDPTLNARQLDLVWMVSHALDKDKLPMWVGFNATFHKDNLPRQEMRYMPNVRQPITGLDAIQETLRMTQRCSKECNQEYGIVTYDLNAAKPAMQIQTTENAFDDVFVMLGSFHVEMAFFKAIGKLIADSGGTNMLTETDVLAPGSLNGFITGKHFNRCKRLHPILALAFEILHFQSFLEPYDDKDEIQALVADIQLNEEELQVTMTSSVFLTCAADYELFTKQTRSGAHGSTAQFWMMYIDYIRQFHHLERSIRTNNLDLYVYSLTGIIDLFFATNHINYCRWLTKFQLDLLNIEDSHPGLRDILEQGAFAVRRTDHPFSRCPVDLTLEQTINADAASRLTGLTSSTNNYGARLRWMVTKSTRASFIRLLQEMAGLVVKADTTAELRPARVKRDTKALKQVVKQIKDSCNPFDRDREKESMPVLYNIHTGKAISEEVRQSLLNVPVNGKARHEEFLQACENDAARFEERIPKAQLKTFSDECATNRRATDKRVAVLKCTRDLMGRLVILASKRDLDLQHIFQFPLTPVPLSMCCPGGMMAKTDKSQLLKILEGKQEKSRGPQQINAYIIDGQYLLHSLPPNLPPTYGGLARIILLQALTLSKVRLDIVFDDYPQPSLKDAERVRRGAAIEDSRSYMITGPPQRRPKNISDALKSRFFKKELPAFLAKEWTDPAYVQVLGSCHVYLDVPEGECFHFYVEDGNVNREGVEALKNNHEEADTKVCLHALATDCNDTNIAVRASDTDIAVILIHHCDKFAGTVWMDVGTTSKKDRRFINISSVAKSLGQNMCAALPEFHSFTGSDYTSAFVRKGKKRPFVLLEKDKEAQKAFRDIGTDADPSQRIQEILLNFTATIYGAKKEGTSLNKCRFQAFEKVYRPKSTGKNPLDKLKGIDACGVPPCESEVTTHIKRAAFVSRMWAHADEAIIQQHPSEKDGWELIGGVYTPIWFEGQQLPDTMVPEDETDEMENDESVERLEVASSDEEDGVSDEEVGNE